MPKRVLRLTKPFMIVLILISFIAVLAACQNANEQLNEATDTGANVDSENSEGNDPENSEAAEKSENDAAGNENAGDTVLQQPLELVVDSAGNGDFTSIQAAIDSIPEGYEAQVTISLQPGTYEEKIKIPHNQIRLIGTGENPEDTVLTYSDYWSMIGPDGEQLGIEGSASTTISGNDFYAENVTFENPADKGQAVALHVLGDRAEFVNVRIIGNQDTLYANGTGRQYYKDSYIEGDADFIFGSATAVFDNCVIHSVGVRYITAASTPEDQEFGFVFLDSELTPNKWVPMQSIYLGRPWRPHAHVAFINTEMGKHIQKAGWKLWDDEDETPKETATFVEYNSTGQGANPDERVDWSKQLTAEEAAVYTVPNVLGGEDGWIPESYEE